MRDTITTNQFARLSKVTTATILRARSVSSDGSYLGVRPVKLSNRALRWPRADVEKALQGRS